MSQSEDSMQTVKAEFVDGTLTLTRNDGADFKLTGDVDFQLMRRLVAAYNTCRFISTDALEKDMVPQLMAGVELSSQTISKFNEQSKAQGVQNEQREI